MDKSSKKKLTQEITQYLQDQITNSDSEEVKKVWGDKQWTPGDFFQTGDSFRLRPAGHSMLRMFFGHDQYEHDRPFNAGEILIFSRRMNAPFFISKNKIVIYSSQYRVWFKLSGGIEKWLKKHS